jgi:mRNA-degrading endonuclease YafQ of YafQ-DinJ toxin-antitoxin module
MLKSRFSHAMKKDIARMPRRGHDLEELADVVRALAGEAALPACFDDHSLRGSGVDSENATYLPIG